MSLLLWASIHELEWPSNKANRHWPKWDRHTYVHLLVPWWREDAPARGNREEEDEVVDCSRPRVGALAVNRLIVCLKIQNVASPSFVLVVCDLFWLSPQFRQLGRCGVHSQKRSKQDTSACQLLVQKRAWKHDRLLQGNCKKVQKGHCHSWSSLPLPLHTVHLFFIHKHMHDSQDRDTINPA